VKSPAARIEPPQIEMSLPTADSYRLRMLAERLVDACRDVAESQGYKATAADLDEIFGRVGHPVSESTLRNALMDRERNYWRGEWVPYFAARSPLVASIVSESTRSPLSAEQTLELLERLGPDECGASFKRLLAKVKGVGR
jgi:hypothetical protein